MFIIYTIVVAICFSTYMAAKTTGREGYDWDCCSKFVGVLLGIAGGLLLLSAGFLKPDDVRCLVHLALTLGMACYYVAMRIVHSVKCAEYDRKRMMAYKYARQNPVRSSFSQQGVNYYGR